MTLLGRRRQEQRGGQAGQGHAGQGYAGPGRPGERGQEQSRHRWRILALVLVGTFMAVLDTTIVNVALPSIAAGTHAASADLEWIVSGYALAFGLTLVPAGRLGDRFGAKTLFVAGLAVFTVASLACGLSQGPAELVAARIVQGVGAGAFYPAVSATIQRLFTGGERSRAFGYFGGMVGISTAAGPLIGGLLIQFLGMTDGWRWVFLVNVFIGAAELPLAVKLLPRRRDREQHRFDPAGNLLLAGTLLLLLVPLVEGRAAGWPLWSWLCLAGSPVLAALLWAWETRLARRGGEPVIQVGLLRLRSFAVGQSLALLYFAGFGTLFFTLSILWQQGLGRSALETGLLVLPMALASLLSAANSYRFSQRFGRTTILAGICGMLLGQALVLLVLHLGAPQPSPWLMAGPLALAGLGNGLVIAPNQDFVLGSVPRDQAGTAGGALTTAQRIGAAIGIAVIGVVLFGGGTGQSAGSGSGGGHGASQGSSHSAPAKPSPQLVSGAEGATAANLGFILAALLCGLALPRRLGDERAGENA